MTDTPICERKHPPRHMDHIGAGTWPGHRADWWQCPTCNHTTKTDTTPDDSDQEALF